MKQWNVSKQGNRNSFPYLIKSVLFGLLVMLSCGSFAQDTPATPEPVEMERVHINKADADTIARVLDGVGMSRAQAIVTFREEYGDFTSEDDLLMVRGVGEVTLRNNAGKIEFD